MCIRDRDKAWQALHDMANMAQDAIINARLKKEFGIFPQGHNERDEEGNVVRSYRFCIYEGDVEKSWTQAFVETCANVNRELAKELGENVVIPDGYYENIALFRELFNKYRKENKQEISMGVPTNSSSPGSGSQGQPNKKDNSEEQNSAGGLGSQDQPEDGPQGQAVGGLDEKIRKAIEKVLSGNTPMDNHDQNTIEDVKKKMCIRDRDILDDMKGTVMQPGVVLLDEMNRAGTDIQSKLLTYLLDHKISGFTVHPLTLVVGAENPISVDPYGTMTKSIAMIDRCLYIDMSDYNMIIDGWFEWLEEKYKSATMDNDICLLYTSYPT